MDEHLHSYLCLALLATASLAASAQRYEVTGHIYERVDTLSPLSLCTVELLRPTDSLRLAYTTSDNSGHFRLPYKAGRYVLRTTFIGYAAHTQNVSLTASKPRLNVGEIILEGTHHRLGEAEVTALSRQLTIKADTFIYNTSGFQLAAGESLAALIKQMPGLAIDSEGKLTFQGKEVSSILVNGKEFFGDNETALANMPAEAVKDVKAYEKTGEKEAFTGSVDANKATVIDLTVKKEYLGAWNINLDAGGGSRERYQLKGFASTFTDRRRLAVYASVNNVSESPNVDENGNWFNFRNILAGTATYRKGGLMYTYDNGRADNAPGAFKVNANASVGQENFFNDERQNTTSLLTDYSSLYTYQRTLNHSRSRRLNGNASMRWVIDSLNYVQASLNYNYSDGRNRMSQMWSTYDKEQTADDAYASLMLGGSTADGVYGFSNANVGTRDYNYYSGSATLVHRFRKAGRSFSADFSFSGSGSGHDADWLTDYRYFRPDAPHPELLNRQLDDTDGDYQSYSANAAYEEPLSKMLRVSVNYAYSYSRSNDGRNLWQLDRAEGFNTMEIPVGVHPLLTPELLNVPNSYDGTEFNNSHQANISLGGKWDRFEFMVSGRGSSSHRRLRYWRNAVSYHPSRTCNELSPRAYFQWKIADNTSLNIFYNASHSFNSLLSRLPISDDANEMSVSVNNPNLRDAWNNYLNLNLKRFNAKTGNSFSVIVGGSVIRNAVVNAIYTDAVTGKRVTTQVNVNGNKNLNFSSYNSLALDSARHWNLSLTPQASYSDRYTYIGDSGDANGLSRQRSYSTALNSRLSYRNGIWSVALKGQWLTEMARYAQAASSNETGHQYELGLSPQLEWPFGLKVYTAFTFWGRFNYADPMLNHPQWIWNLSVEQKLLKKKNLTLRLEGVDILHERTAEFVSNSPTGRFYSSMKCIPSYWMFHIIYRINTKV